MQARLAVLTVLIALLIACGDEARFVLVVKFPDEASKQQTEEVWVAVVKPPEGADCTDLVAGTARPGEGGYDIEDEMTFILEGMEGARPLKLETTGLRLFYAEALDPNGIAILRGCIEEEVGEGRAKVVTILLQRVCQQDSDCDNGLWCDGDEVCINGVCQSGTRDCNDSDICTQDICNEDLDACEHPPVTEPPGTEGPVGETTCDDGIDNDCDGLTDGADPACVSCQADADCEDNNACTTDTCDTDTSLCVNTPVDDGETCDDGLFCTVGDVCTGGRCGGTSRDCSSLTNQCNQGICDEDGNQCLAQPANEGQTCDDGLYCTLGETCQAGVCTGDTQRDCQDDDSCTQDRCDETSNSCQHVLVPRPGQESLNIDGTCTDGLDNDCDLLTDGDDPDCLECTQDGDCDDGNVCTTNTCGADNHCETTFVTDGTTCDDGLLCTEADACSAGVCSGTGIDCSAMDDDCNLGFCNEASGQCEPQPINEGQACSDGTFCTTGETCQAGVCTGGTDRDCSAEDDDCNLGVCDEGSGACVKQPANEGGGCDDGSYCNTGETCQSGSCTGGQQRDCDDLEECTQDSCDDNLDQCVNAPLPDGTECGTRSCVGLDLIIEVCQSGTCSGNQVISCDDGTPCTDDACDPSGCRNTPNSGGCPDIHIGPAADTCPHDDGGGPVTTCDYTGETGLAEAAAAAPAAGANFLLYDDLGSPAGYVACSLDIPGESHLSAAPGVDFHNVHIYCDVPDDENGTLHLAGDGVHIDWLTFVVTAGTRTTLSAWDLNTDPSITTGGHLIENVVSMALQPEVCGSNSIQEPFYLGPDCTLRNSHIWGYFENDWRWTNVHRTRVVNNTFIIFQQEGDTSDIIGVSDLTVANNVFGVFASTEPLMMSADATTTGLTVAGNVLEGYQDIVAGDTASVVQDNILGQLEVESPYVPLFLSDSTQTQTAGTVVPGEGVSLDGVSIEGRTDMLPGAFQNRSSLSLPRRTTIKVGERNNACGGRCDFIQSDDNEIQLAAWTVFPGGTVEVYPSTDPYAGNVIIGWPIDIVGMGAQPEDVVLQSLDEEPDWSFYGLWGGHGGIISVIRDMGAPVTVEKLALLVDTDTQAGERAVFTEKSDSLTLNENWHQFRRLRVESQGTTAGLSQAFYLGDRVRVQDVLIHGDFHTCIRFGTRSSDRNATPATTGHVVNLTCRLTGTGTNDAESGLDVASVVDSRFVNLAIEFPDSAVSLFRAQRRTTGDTGTTALDVPTSYIAHSITASIHDTHSDGYDPVDGTYTETEIDELAAGIQIFVSAADSHLNPACATCDALDRGVDPSTVDPDLAAGTSLDGIDRGGMTIDRGCYEEGQ